MHTNEEIICRAEIDCKTRKYPIHTFIIGFIIAVFTNNYIVSRGLTMCWFGWEECYYTEDIVDFFFILRIPVIIRSSESTFRNPAGIILLIISLTFIIAFPLIVSHIKRHNSKISFLYLTKDCIYGFRKTLFRKRAVQIKLEDLSDIFSYTRVRDTLKKVETLYISYEGGEITFHNVTNAQEFVEAVMTQYNHSADVPRL